MSLRRTQLAHPTWRGAELIHEVPLRVMEQEAPPPQPHAAAAEPAPPPPPAPDAAASDRPPRPPAGSYVQQPQAPPVGGLGTLPYGVPLNRRVSNATETTPLFLGDESGEGHNKPLCVRRAAHCALRLALAQRLRP